MRLATIIITILCSSIVFSQESKLYFELEISKHIKAFNSFSERAVSNNDTNAALVLFDSLVKTHLKDTYVSEMVLKKVNGGKFSTSKIKNPFLLITKSEWEQISQKEIEAINMMSKLYKGQIDFVILFWTSKAIAKKRSSGFNSLITVTFVDERQNNADHIVKSYKHSFGAPSCFFISENKQLINIDRKFTENFNLVNIEEAFKSTHEEIKSIISRKQAFNVDLPKE
ncbi:hypothetical protein [Psychroserpens sp.]|uniref:hypothetical protein n=1 Tax=Psychroserpens sp. TaxID=2020870 RepID=UPI003C77CD57